MSKTIIAGTVSFLCVLTCTQAYAAEGGFYSGPIGGSDIRSALVGTPGSLSLTAVPLFNWSSLFTGPDGGRSAQHPSVAYSVYTIAGTLTYVYPWTWRGGKFSTHFQENYSFGDLREGSNSIANSGQSDAYVTFLEYSAHVGMFGAEPPTKAVQDALDVKIPYGLTIAPMFSMTIPIGRYNSRQALNEGHADWIFVPNVSLTYSTGPKWSLGDSTEFSTRLYYEVATRNQWTGYLDGNTFVSDFALSQRFNRLQVGFGGTVATATGNDTVYTQPASPQGARLFDFLIGPLVQYDFPKLGLSVGAKLLFEGVSHNRLEHNTALIRITKRLF